MRRPEQYDDACNDTDYRARSATPILNLYPTSTVGSFTVTATVDGTYPPISATYQLTIAARVPTPTINANTTTTTTNAVRKNAVTSPTAPGLSPPGV